MHITKLLTRRFIRIQDVMQIDRIMIYAPCHHKLQVIHLE